MTDDFSITRWFMVNGNMTLVTFKKDITYVDGVSVQWQDENFNLHLKDES